MLEQERPHLVDHGRALYDDALAHPVERLQLQLLGRLQRDAPYAGAAARFRDGGGIMEIVLIRLHVRLHELRGQQAHLMAGLRKDPAPV